MLCFIFCNVGLVLIGFIVNKFVRKMSFTKLCHMLAQVFPTAIFFVMTYAIYTPSSLFLQNISEFSITYLHILPSLLFLTFIIFMIILFIALCVVSDKNVIFFTGFLFAITLGLYVQGNFLNPKFPTLDGAPIDWSMYYKRDLASKMFWVVVPIAVMIVSFGRWKTRLQQVMKYLSCFLSAVQAVSLLMLLIMSKPDIENYGLSKEGEFSVGAKENIVIFIVDTLQTSSMKEYLISDACPIERFDGFTFFENAVSGGSPTSRGLPVFLTGVEYDPLQSEYEWAEERWEAVPLYDYLRQDGFDIRFYSDLSIPGVSDKIIDNYVPSSKYVGDYASFTEQLYRLVNLYLMPQCLKQYFWLTTDDLTEAILADENIYKIGNTEFYKDMEAAGPFQVEYEKTFRLYHLSGVHLPYITDENLQIVGDGAVTEQQVLQGVMKEIYEYVDHMQTIGVYDASTIIIAGDHGRFEDNNPGANAAFLIKRPYEDLPLQYNTAPVHFRNVMATLAETLMDDYSSYGPSMYDITDASDVERMHTIDTPIRNRNSIDDAWDRTVECRFIVPLDPEDVAQYKIWDPYRINSIDYKLGEEIDYTINNSYANQINYRLYKENQAAIASNELSICFNLQDTGAKDLVFHYTYSGVYNERQTMHIYANGSKVDTVVCTNTDKFKDDTVVIPGDKIEDGVLILRFVFPNAVTPNQLDRTDEDTRILSVAFASMRLERE